MIDFVAERAGHEPFAAELALLSVAIGESHFDALRPRDVFDEVGNRETTLFFGDLPFELHEFGIDEDVQIARLLADRQIDYRQPFRDSDLVRGQSDARRG